MRLFSFALLVGAVSAQTCPLEVALDCRTTTGIPCNTLRRRTTDCFVTILYTISIRNGGGTPSLRMTQVDLTTQDGTTNQLLLSLPVNPITTSTSISPRRNIDLCMPKDYRASVSAAAEGLCSRTLEYRFSVGTGVVSGNPPVMNTPVNPSPAMMPRPFSVSQPVPRAVPILQPFPQPVPVPRPVFQPFPQPVPVPRPVVAPTPRVPSQQLICGRIEASISCNLASNGNNCNTLRPRANSCTETLRYSLTLRNTGQTPLEVTVANLRPGGSAPVSVLNMLPSRSFAAGQSRFVVVPVDLNVCTNNNFIDFNANGQFGGAIPAGTNCVQVPVPSPVAPPVAVMPAPRPAPVPAPVARPVVDCTFATEFTCKLIDGRSCAAAGSRRPPERCLESFFYDLTLRNRGTIDLPVTVATFTNGQSTNNLLSRISRNPVPAGSSSFATLATVVNLCEAYSLAGGVNVRVQPPMNVICSSAIPQPTTINIGGPPQPRPVPAPVRVPTAPVQVNVQAQVVDCIIDTRLESCTLENGVTPCQQVNVNPCRNVTFYYSVALENRGTVVLTVTEAGLKTNGRVINMVPLLMMPSLQVGAAQRVRVPVNLNVCTATQFSAEVSARAVPPAGFVCR